MTRRVFIIANDNVRARVLEFVRALPLGIRCEFKEPTRSLEANAKMWACLTDISEQVVWYGTKLTPDDWKDVLTASLRKARVVPGIDPGSLVPLGMRTSDMTKKEMSNLIELIHAFGAEHGVVFHDAVMKDAEKAG